MTRNSSNQKDLLQEREKLHAMLLSSVSHDLKTPLACVIGSLEIYQQLKGTLSEEHKNTLIATAIDEARHLDSFVTNILDMAKLERGVFISHELTDIVQIIRQCLLQMQPRLPHYELKLELPRKLMAEVSAPWIGRAVMLLLDNAVRYTPVGTKIRISLYNEKDFFLISVSDNGPGIPPKRRKEIFHKRERVARQDAKTAGTGLGLSICKAIMEAHGGIITLECPVEAGSIFTLKLPLVAKKVKKYAPKKRIT